MMTAIIILAMIFMIEVIVMIVVMMAYFSFPEYARISLDVVAQIHGISDA